MENLRELWYDCLENDGFLEVNANFGEYSYRMICCIVGNRELVIREELPDRVRFGYWPKPFAKNFDTYKEGKNRIYIIYEGKVLLNDIKNVSLIGYGTSDKKMRINLVSNTNGKYVGELQKDYLPL